MNERVPETPDNIEPSILPVQNLNTHKQVGIGVFDSAGAPFGETTKTFVSRIRTKRFTPRAAIWVEVDETTTLATVLARATEAPRVWLVGSAHKGGRIAAAEWASGPLPAGWSEHPNGHYLDGHYSTFRFVHEIHGDREILNAGSWFGDVSSAQLCADAWQYLERRVGETWRGATLLATPATTGRDLWLRGLGSREFPTLPDDLQHLIRSTSGQGRIETFNPGDGDQWRDRFVVYDARLAYAGCIRELGHGEPSWDTLDVFEPHARGRYLVTFEPPEDWGHVGILPVADPDGFGWRWPTSGRWQTWADGSELLVAGRAGWRFTIQARLIWPSHRGRPLDSWCMKLLDVQQSAIEPVAEIRPLIRAAVRSILLHSLGAFAGRPHKLSHRGPQSEIHAGASGVTLDRSTGLYQWTTEAAPAWPEASHPEWSAAVWARQRSRLLSAPSGETGRSVGLLSLHRSDLLGVRTDAIYMTTNPEWPDDGKVGRYTLRSNVEADYRAPRTNADLWRLREEIGG